MPASVALEDPKKKKPYRGQDSFRLSVSSKEKKKATQTKKQPNTCRRAKHFFQRIEKEMFYRGYVPDSPGLIPFFPL
jgi:hypothetical protein